jgi:hypothetical protein
VNDEQKELEDFAQAYGIDRECTALTGNVLKEDDPSYWLRQTPQARFAAVEFLRRLTWGKRGDWTYGEGDGDCSTKEELNTELTRS